MNRIESQLKMENLYVKEMQFNRKLNIAGEKKLAINYKINHIKTGEYKEKIELITSISDDVNDLNILLNIVGDFEYIKGKSDDEDLIHHIMTVNTIAIMFPFVRSQMAVLTSQPGLVPIMLPVIDVSKFIDETNDVNH